MKSTLLTRDIQTGDITVMSNVTSVTVVGTKVSRLADSPEQEQVAPSTVHIDFEIKEPTQLQTLLESTEALGMILNSDDAVELGELLIAMGLNNRDPKAIATVMSDLNQFIHDFSHPRFGR